MSIVTELLDEAAHDSYNARFYRRAAYWIVFYQVLAAAFAVACLYLWMTRGHL